MGFKKKSTYDGTCKKEASHTWKIGDEIFMQKKDDGSWLLCNDLECFKSQGGIVEEKPAKGQGRTVEMSLAFGKAFDDWAWNVAVQRTEQRFPKDKGVYPDWEKERNQFLQSIYRSLVMAFNGK